MAKAKKMAFGGLPAAGGAQAAAHPIMQRAMLNGTGPVGPQARPMAQPMASQMATTSTAPAVMKKGGMVRGDGAAIRGKTKGKCC